MTATQSKKRVLLVNSNTEQAPYPVPPLGLCLVAEGLGQRFKVRVYDGVFDHGKGLGALLERFSPHYVGLGVRNVDDLMMRNPTSYIRNIRRSFVEPIRSLTQAVLVVGGSGYSLFPREMLRALDADYGVVGEGERTFAALLDALELGESVTGQPGVVTRAECSGALYPAAPKSAPQPAPPLDARRLPWSNIDHWTDFTPYRARGAYPIQTKRGCTHRCVYCTYPAIEGRRYRVRDVDQVVDELAAARHRLGDVAFELVDSIFNDPPGHAENICREIVARGLKVRLRTMGINPRGTSPRLLQLMRAAGFAQIDCTPDSAAPAVIRAMGKSFDRPKLERAALAIRQAAMPTMWFFLCGGPGETAGTFAETLDFIDRFIDPLDLVYLGAGIRVYPGTRLHAIATADGVLEPDVELLSPRFYVSPRIGPRRLEELIEAAARTRPNCLPMWETRPSPRLHARAAELRQQHGLQEPMFRTLLRARREELGEGPAVPGSHRG